MATARSFTKASRTQEDLTSAVDSKISLAEEVLANSVEYLVNTELVEKDVAPYKDKPARRIMPYRVKRVVNPFEFYVEYSLPDMEDYDTWFREMQSFYDNPKTAIRYKLKAEGAIPGRCYVSRDFNTNQWHRVRAHGHRRLDNMVLIFFCDIGTRQLVKTADLLEIDPRFCRYAAQLFRAYLYDITPNDGTVMWPEEICDRFQKEVMGKEFMGIVMCRSDSIAYPGYPEMFINVGLVLYESSMDSDLQRCTLNAIMVKKGWARAIGVFAACDHLLEIEDYRPEFDKQRYASEFPPLLNASAARKLEASEGGDEVGAIRGCSVMDLRPDIKNTLWIKALNSPDIDFESEDGIFSNMTDKLPVEFQRRLCRVKLSYVIGPHHILLHLLNRMDDLHSMQEVLGRIVEDTRPLSEEELSPGMFISCRIFNELTKTSIWCRAVVKSTLPNMDFVRIFLVDYGNDMPINPSFCRVLPETFLQIPTFVIRAHLDVPGLEPSSTFGWSNDACLTFRRYAFAWADTDPLYFAFRTTTATRRIELNDYMQEIFYSNQSKSWYSGAERSVSKHDFINQHKDTPILRGYFLSVGVQLHYEVTVKKCAFWFFEPLHDNLIAANYANNDTNKLFKPLLHVDIINTVTDDVEAREPVRRSFTLHSLAITPKYSLPDVKDVSEAKYVTRDPIRAPGSDKPLGGGPRWRHAKSYLDERKKSKAESL